MELQWTKPEVVDQIKKIYGRTLSDLEFQTFIQIGRATGLNPFLREIWAVKYGNSPAQIFVGRDGYRKSAQAHPEYEYHLSDAVYSNDKFGIIDGEVKHQYELANRGELLGAYCIVKRKSSSKYVYTFVELKEYSTNKSLWAQVGGKPATMIKKVAEAQALRMAFQSLFSGTYHEYEQWQDADVEVIEAQPTRGIEGLKARLGLEAPSVDDLIERINQSQNLAQLKSLRELASQFPDNDKAKLRSVYMEKQKQFNRSNKNV